MPFTGFFVCASCSGKLRIKSAILLLLLFSACDNLYKNDYYDNSPTSGKLKVYCDEGLLSHVQNHAFTFMTQYPAATIEVVPATEERAIAALISDSCEAIVVSRLLSSSEEKLLASRKYSPKYSHVATTGVCLVAGKDLSFNSIHKDSLKRLLTGRRTHAEEPDIKIVIDKNNSAVMRYLQDSVLKGESFGPHCSSAGSTPEVLAYVSASRRAIGIIDFAWISDRDDSLYKVYQHKMNILGIRNDSGYVAFPSQSSFKLGTYALSRPVYVMRKVSDFTLAKGFESFVAGPRGQLIFLKQGLMPARQSERKVEVKFEQVAQ